MIRVSLNLSKHCIQTETRRVYNRLLNQCLKSPGADPEREEKVELLVEALENFDFSRLRAEYAELAGGSQASVALVREEDGRIVITIDERVILP